MRPPIVHVFDDERELAHAAAEAIVFAARQAVAERGEFHWALSGGSTPKRTYGVLAGTPFCASFPWKRSHAWIGDERVVPQDDPASNRRMIVDQLYRPASIDLDSLHAYDTSIAPDAAASAYAAAMASQLADPPVLDLVLLGLGTDAHTASWFPGSSFDGDRWVAATEEHAGYRRLTLTPTAVNAARRVLFLVSGESKRDAVERVFEGPRDPLNVPAQRVSAVDGQVMWLLVRDAAGHSFAD
jgi:6-phosphogluconolactonase